MQHDNTQGANRWRRFDDWDKRPLRLDNFAVEDPENGFSAMHSANDPAPAFQRAGRTITSMDGVAEEQFDMIDLFIACYHLDPDMVDEAMIIKFMLPNRHAIYLHDTPSKALFGRTQRAFSHGCIRVYKPLEFGVSVLRNEPGWNLQRLRRVVETRKTTRVRLKQKVPVHIVYATAWRGEGGSVEFRKDIYSRDKKLYNGLMDFNRIFNVFA